MIIKKLYLYILKQFFILFIPSLLVTLFILVLQALWFFAADLIGKGISFGVIMEFFYYIALANFFLAMPVAVLLASIMTFGNMGEHFELTAVKSAGISLYRLMRPIFILAVLFTIGTFIFANYVIPYATLKSTTLIVSIRQKHPTLQLTEGIFNNDVSGYVIRVGKKDKKSGMMYDFLIYDHTNYTGNKFVIAADSGTIKVTEDMKFMIIQLYNGSQYEELKEDTRKAEDKKYPYHQDFFTDQRIIIPLKGFNLRKTDNSLFANNFNMLNSLQLLDRIDSLKRVLANKQNYYYTVIYRNDILKQQIKLRTKVDSMNLMADVKALDTLSPKRMPVIYNLDSVYKSADLVKKYNIAKQALVNAENLRNRITMYESEYASRRSWTAMYQIAFHKKIVYSLAVFIFFFIGAPLGAIIRRGGFGLPTIISVILFLIFYLIVTFGERFARDGVVSPFAGMWAAVFIFVPLFVYLMYKVATDSAIFNWDYIIETFKLLIKRIRLSFKLKNKIK